MTRREAREKDAAPSQSAEGGLAMSATGEAVAPLVVSDDASGLGKATQPLMAGEPRLKLRFDRPLDVDLHEKQDWIAYKTVTIQGSYGGRRGAGGRMGRQGADDFLVGEITFLETPAGVGLHGE